MENLRIINGGRRHTCENEEDARTIKAPMRECAGGEGPVLNYAIKGPPRMHRRNPKIVFPTQIYRSDRIQPLTMGSLWFITHIDLQIRPDTDPPHHGLPLVQVLEAPSNFNEPPYCIPCVVQVLSQQLLLAHQ